MMGDVKNYEKNKLGNNFNAKEQNDEEKNINDTTKNPTGGRTRQNQTTQNNNDVSDDDNSNNDNVIVVQNSRSSLSPTSSSSHSATISNGSIFDSVKTLEFTSTNDRTIYNKVCRFANQLRLLTGYVVNSSQVQFIIVMLIAINAVMMGIGTFDFVQDDPDVNDAFELVDYIFLIIFTIELGCQFVYHGLRLFIDGWLLFDFVIIIVSWAFGEVQIIRAFRIFRALRLITRIKVMKNLILALISVMPRMAAIGMLLFLIFYIFAVMFTQLFKDLYHSGQTEEDYFSRLDSTFLTQFQFMTLDNWASVVRQVILVYRWGWAPIVAFVVITGFIVVNLIIAVICDAVAALSEDDRNRMAGHVDDDDGSDEDKEEHSNSTSSKTTTDNVSNNKNENNSNKVPTVSSKQSTTTRKKNSISSASQSTIIHSIHKQLDVLQDEVNEITKMQESTLMLLQKLTKR